MKIAMVFDGLQIGGIERGGADYAKILTSAGHDVTIINLRPHLTDLEKEFPSSCHMVHFNYSRKLTPEQYNKAIRMWNWGKYAYPIMATALFPLNIALKMKSRMRIKKQYDLTIAFSGHFNDLTFVADGFVKSKHKLCWLHGALYSYLLLSDGFLNLYRKIKNLVVLVESGQHEVFEYNKYLHLNIHQLYNPSFIAEKQVNDREAQRLKEKYGKYIVMVSRIKTPPKNPYTLIDAFALVFKKHEDLNLVFVGDGPDRVKAIEYAKAKGVEISNHIFFEGAKKNVQDYYKSAFMLVQSSEFEGLPTTLIEALYFNLPIVATDCPTGPREILGNNDFGLLCKVHDASDMARQINLLYENEELYNHYKKNSSKRTQAFMPETIKGKLLEILSSIMEEYK